MPQNDREYVFKPALNEDDSPASIAIEFLSRKWTRTIVEVLLDKENLRYNELKDELDGISDKALSEALEGLEKMQLVDREVVDDRPVKVEYSLTEAGKSLETIIKDFIAWKHEYVEYIGSIEDGSGVDSDE